MPFNNNPGDQTALLDHRVRCTSPALCNVCREIHACVELYKATSISGSPPPGLQKLRRLRNTSHSSFIRQLPVEIQNKIFLDVVGPLDFYSDVFLARSVRVREHVILSAVCSDWRSIAINLPQLWTKVYINVHREPVPFTTELLDRSKLLPLYLTLYGQSDCLLQDIDPSLVTLLREHSARWAYLSIEHVQSQIAQSLHRLFDNLPVLPMSDFFHLRLGNYSIGQNIVLPTLFQQSYLQSYRDGIAVSAKCFGWKNLTCLELRRYNPRTVLDIIRQAPQLKNCKLLLMLSTPSSGALQPPENRSGHIVAEFLEHLVLTFECASAHFFQNLTIPSLRHLECEFNAVLRSETDFQELGLLLQRSEIQSLETFFLRCFASSWPRRKRHQEQLLGLSNITASLTCLEVVVRVMFPNTQAGSSFDSFLKAIGTTAFPHLQELQLALRTLLCKGHANIGSETCTAIYNFIEEHNRKCNAAIDLTVTRENYDICVGGNVANQIFSNHTTNLNTTMLKAHQYRPVLKIVSIHGFDLSIEMSKNTWSLLQKEQKVGPLQLEVHVGDEVVDLANQLKV